nr:MAG TPA: hypothetical protein [Caudoviricetes sp.]
MVVSADIEAIALTISGLIELASSSALMLFANSTAASTARCWQSRLK